MPDNSAPDHCRCLDSLYGPCRPGEGCARDRAPSGTHLCGCDGYGVRVDKATGIIVKCPDCGGRPLSNAEVKAARRAR